MILIGHGRSQLWCDLKDHLKDKHHYQVETLESGVRAIHGTRDILDSMINKCSFALLVLAKEDETRDGDVFVRNRNEWQGWQENRPKNDMFNREFIFSLMEFYHETETWLFGGVYKVTGRLPDRYEVKLVEDGKGFVGRLKLESKYKSRNGRVNFENHYSNFTVLEILREPYSG